MDLESAKQMDQTLEALAKQFFNGEQLQAHAVELMQRELEPMIHQRLAGLRWLI